MTKRQPPWACQFEVRSVHGLMHVHSSADKRSDNFRVLNKIGGFFLDFSRILVADGGRQELDLKMIG